MLDLQSGSETLYASLTFGNPWLERFQKIDRRSIPDGFELLVVRDMNVRAQVMGGKSQTDNQPSVAENLLLITENRIGKLRMKAGQGLWFFFVRLNDGDMHGVVGVAGP